MVDNCISINNGLLDHKIISLFPSGLYNTNSYNLYNLHCALKYNSKYKLISVNNENDNRISNYNDSVCNNIENEVVISHHYEPITPITLNDSSIRYMNTNDSQIVNNVINNVNVNLFNDNTIDNSYCSDYNEGTITGLLIDDDDVENDNINLCDDFISLNINKSTNNNIDINYSNNDYVNNEINNSDCIIDDNSSIKSNISKKCYVMNSLVLSNKTNDNINNNLDRHMNNFVEDTRLDNWMNNIHREYQRSIILYSQDNRNNLIYKLIQFTKRFNMSTNKTLIVTSKNYIDSWAKYIRQDINLKLLLYNESLSSRRHLEINHISQYDVVITTFDILRAKEVSVPEYYTKISNNSNESITWLSPRSTNQPVQELNNLHLLQWDHLIIDHNEIRNIKRGTQRGNALINLKSKHVISAVLDPIDSNIVSSNSNKRKHATSPNVNKFHVMLTPNETNKIKSKSNSLNSIYNHSFVTIAKSVMNIIPSIPCSAITFDAR